VTQIVAPNIYDKSTPVPTLNDISVIVHAVEGVGLPGLVGYFITNGLFIF